MTLSEKSATFRDHALAAHFRRTEISARPVSKRQLSHKLHHLRPCKEGDVLQSPRRSWCRVGKGAGHNDDLNTRSFAAPCPRVGREGEPGRKRVGTARMPPTDMERGLGIARLCPPYTALAFGNGFLDAPIRNEPDQGHQDVHRNR